MKIIVMTFILVSFSLIGFANNLALPCYGCHVKQNHNSTNSSIPIIEGLPQKYIINAFKEYKSKIRDNYLMHIISKGYSDEEIKAIAFYFSKMKLVND